MKNAKPTSSVKYKPYLPSNLEEYDGLTPNGLVIYDANGHPYIVPIPEPVVQSFAVNSEKETDLFGGYQKNSGGDDIEVGGEQHASRRSSNFSGNDGRRPQSSSAASHYTPRVSTQSNRSMKIALGVFDGKSQLRPVGIQDRGSSQGDAPAYFIPVEILSLTPEKEDVQNPISPSSPTAIDNAAATESLQPTTANNNYNNQVSPISLTSQNLADSSALATRNLPCKRSEAKGSL